MGLNHGLHLNWRRCGAKFHCTPWWWHSPVEPEKFDKTDVGVATVRLANHIVSSLYCVCCLHQRVWRSHSCKSGFQTSYVRSLFCILLKSAAFHIAIIHRSGCKPLSDTEFEGPIIAQSPGRVTWTKLFSDDAFFHQEILPRSRLSPWRHRGAPTRTQSVQIGSGRLWHPTYVEFCRSTRSNFSLGTHQKRWNKCHRKLLFVIVFSAAIQWCNDRFMMIAKSTRIDRTYFVGA